MHHHDPHSYVQVKRNMKALQKDLDIASDHNRWKQVGNLSWLVMMPMYVWSVIVANPAIKNICQVGFGVGHSTTIFLTASPHANVYTFDIFPQNTTQTNLEMGDYMLYLPATQNAGRAYMNATFPGMLTRIKLINCM